jgi:hypothetical protein
MELLFSIEPVVVVQTCDDRDVGGAVDGCS